MRNLRYAFLGLICWGCDAFPDSLSTYSDSTSTSALASVGDGSEESDPNRRGCGEEDTAVDPSWNQPDDLEPSQVMDTGFGNEIWDEETVDTGEVYLDQ